MLFRVKQNGTSEVSWNDKSLDWNVDWNKNDVFEDSLNGSCEKQIETKCHLPL